MVDFKKLFNTFSSLKVGVIGDVMLDTYIWGQVDRISPEAPVPIVLLERREQRIGGAGNVALNCKSLGAQVSVLSVTGDDTNGKSLRSLFGKEAIDTQYLMAGKERSTTNKIRIICRNQQMMRLDDEVAHSLSEQDEEQFLKTIEDFIHQQAPQIIILEDYNKGVLTERVIEQTVSICKSKGIITAVDPKRKNFFAYKGVDIFKPNLKEVKEALNIVQEIMDESTLRNFHNELHKKLKHQLTFITLSQKGVYYQNEKESEVIHSHLRNIADVSGAGDTVIAVASLVFAATQNAKLMAQVANIAGGLVCEEVGTVAVNKDSLLKECERLLV